MSDITIKDITDKIAEIIAKLNQNDGKADPVEFKSQIDALLAAIKAVNDQIHTLVIDLAAISRTTNSTDVDEQIHALSAWWSYLDHQRAGLTAFPVNNAKAQLEAITKDLDSEKVKLQNVAKIIKNIAQAAAIAEKVGKMAA